MTEDSPVPRFGDIAKRLAAAGYSPVPLHFGQKNPIPKEWQRYALNASELGAYQHAGTGLLCGQIVALDIDVREPTLAAELDRLAEETFGPAPRRIGLAPKVLKVLRTEVPFGKLGTRGYRLPSDRPDDKSHRVEVLARGQQFVAYNVHPACGIGTPAGG